MEQFTPYYFDGRLHLPKTTLDALIPHGLDMKTAQTIRKGIDLEDSQIISILLKAIEDFAATAADSPIAVALKTDEVRFILTGEVATAARRDVLPVRS